MAEAVALQISSEDEAWEYLERSLNGELPENTVPAVRFTGWPHVEIYLPHTPIDSSLSPAMMEALLDLQKAIHRTHSLVTTGEKSRLSNAEKDRLELRAQVKGGSSKIDIDLTQIAETWGTALIGKLTPEQAVAVIITAILALGGATVFSIWANKRAEIRKAELEEKGKERLFDAFEKLADEDTKRQKLYYEAMQRLPVLREVSAEADEAKTKLVKAVGEEGGGTVDGIPLDADVANDLVKNARRPAAEETLKSTFRVARVDTTSPDGFRVALRDTKTGEEVTASLMDALISDRHRSLIQAAEWNKEPVAVELRLRVSRGRTLSATVIDVQPAKPASRRAGDKDEQAGA